MKGPSHVFDAPQYNNFLPPTQNTGYVQKEQNRVNAVLEDLVKGATPFSQPKQDQSMLSGPSFSLATPVYNDIGHQNIGPIQKESERNASSNGVLSSVTQPVKEAYQKVQSTYQQPSPNAPTYTKQMECKSFSINDDERWRKQSAHVESYRPSVKVDPCSDRKLITNVYGSVLVDLSTIVPQYEPISFLVSFTESFNTLSSCPEKAVFILNDNSRRMRAASWFSKQASMKGINISPDEVYNRLWCIFKDGKVLGKRNTSWRNWVLRGDNLSSDYVSGCGLYGDILIPHSDNMTTCAEPLNQMINENWDKLSMEERIDIFCGFQRSKLDKEHGVNPYNKQSGANGSIDKYMIPKLSGGRLITALKSKYIDVTKQEWTEDEDMLKIPSQEYNTLADRVCELSMRLPAFRNFVFRLDVNKGSWEDESELLCAPGVVDRKGIVMASEVARLNVKPEAVECIIGGLMKYKFV